MPESQAGASRSPVLHMGTFEAELHWREHNLAILPALPDREAEKIVTAMDELLFSFCQPGDLLLTRYAIDPAQREYTRRLGFDFTSNTTHLQPEQTAVRTPIAAAAGYGQAASPQRTAKENAHPISVFQLLYDYGSALAEQLPLEGAELSPFAWVPYIKEASQRFGIRSQHPPLEIVRSVNTKRYSAEIKQRLGLDHPGIYVTDTDQLETVGRELLDRGTFMIKDNYGVSGKGNIHIESPAMLTRIASSIRKQEDKGRNVEFVLERYLDKEQDFSCQFYITKQGDIEIISVQWLANSQFAYRESLSPDADFMDLLERHRYFEIMEQISRELYRDGYYGHVCIDSMVLQDGSLEPMVEINARQSMSLIKNNIDQYLRQHGLQGNMTNYTVTHDGSLSHEQLLSELQRNQLLFLPDTGQGILPLTSAALSVNHPTEPDGKKHKGRLYLSVVTDQEETKKHLLNQLEQLLTDKGLHILN
ncbi:hypothetical protein [Paenibacillus bovis]|uniref:ATP-grasp domain-containing protein n=1 Tax=Paenibacillus bovis TaxID=1616788 RepID=A0A172ZF23_9BACL|nr:hypothetical protein [Paenibacillus bovis]ANF96235.1 hypothetical protein AR543_09645 [Paenibacillus bovis]